MTLMHMMNAYKLLTKTVVDLPLYDIFYVIVLLKKTNNFIHFSAAKPVMCFPTFP